MFWKKAWWRDEKERAMPSMDALEEGKITHFGFRKVPSNEKVRWVRSHFDTVADKYDFMNTLLSFGIHHIWKRTAVSMSDLRPGDRVIDLCGGTGDLALLAAKAVTASGRIVIYDINRAMMEKGKIKAAKSRFAERIAYVQGDAEAVSFPDGAFDAALIGFGIRNVTNMEKAFKEMYRLLKPGGTLMCLEFSKPTSPLFRWLYDVYSFHIMPWLGCIIVGSKNAYTYLPESIRMFPLPHELSSILEGIGFSKTRYRRLTNGIAVIHLAEKNKG